MSGIALWDHIYRLERLQHRGTFVFTAIEGAWYRALGSHLPSGTTATSRHVCVHCDEAGWMSEV